MSWWQTVNVWQKWVKVLQPSVLSSLSSKSNKLENTGHGHPLPLKRGSKTWDGWGDKKAHVDYMSSGLTESHSRVMTIIANIDYLMHIVALSAYKAGSCYLHPPSTLVEYLRPTDFK